MLKSNMYPVLTPLNKIKLGRQTKKNVSCQKLLECKWIVPFTTIPFLKQVTCLCISRTIGCTGDGEKKYQLGHFFQSYLRNSQGSKVPLASYSRYYSVQIKDWGELRRTKGGCPIFRLPLAGSCTGHILQARTRNLSTTSLSPHLFIQRWQQSSYCDSLT